jgi:NADH-quinone oxidoreductase subunit L
MLLSEAATTGGLFNLVPLVVLIPVIGLLINIIFGGRMGEKAIGAVACVAVGLSFVVAVLLAIALIGNHEGAVVHLFDWIHIGDLNIPWSFRVDTLSVTMMLVVGGVGTLIHIYATGYMHDDVRFQGHPDAYRRFFVYMNLFITTMMLLVSADNYLMLFVGWEGVGLCSYLLIGFWFDKGENGTGNATAGKKAFVTNRIGDFGFLIAAFIMFWAFGTFTFEEVFEQAPAVAEATPAVIMAITVFMLIGVAGKSAQIPLYVWLPDAMAGPTPVSALIHAATMVTAGVYLITRSAELYILVPDAQSIVALVGGVTALFAATIAVAQFDIKKVLAYSTISQLGFMVAAVGMGAFTAGMFHLVTHAFFKALLFLSSGSIILGIEHSHHHLEHDGKLPKGETKLDPQDMRNMGGLRNRMKTTYWVYLIGALTLAGIPPLAGFFSKDEILTEAKVLNPTVYVLLVIAAFFTAFYMGRQIFLVFYGKPRTETAGHAEERPAIITVPLIILAILSVTGGLMSLPGLHTFSHWLEHTLGNVHVEEFNIQVAAISTGLALVAITLAYLLYYRRYQQQQSIAPAKRPDDPLRPILGPVFTLLENKYWVDEIYWALFVNPYVNLSRFLAAVIDWRFWHDWFHEKVLARPFRLFTRWTAWEFDLKIIDGIANWLGNTTVSMGTSLRGIQTGYVRNYALAVIVGVVAIVTFLILR